MAEYLRRHPRSVGLLIGALLGSVVGLWLGNFGVARAGGGFAVTGWALGAVVGAYVGFRVGEYRHRKRG